MAAEKTAIDYLFEATGGAGGGEKEADTRSQLPERRPNARPKAAASADRGEAMGWEDMGTVNDGGAKATTNNNDPGARAEVAEMQKAAPLLDLIREDTGEEGTDRGEYIEFRSCPVCGHKDDARYYRDSNTLHCFGGSNGGRRTLGYCEYMQDVRGMTATEAMKELREVTGHDYADRAGKVGKPRPRAEALG